MKDVFSRLGVAAVKVVLNNWGVNTPVAEPVKVVAIGAKWYVKSIVYSKWLCLSEIPYEPVGI